MHLDSSAGWPGCPLLLSAGGAVEMPAPQMPLGMTLAEIAAKEECSVATVERVLNRAVAKLKRRRIGAFALILEAIVASSRQLLRAGSLECDSEFVEKFYGVGEVSAAFKCSSDAQLRP